MLKVIRLILGSLIALGNLLTRGRKLKRSKTEQAQVENSLTQYALYQFKLCPFCIKVRRKMHQLNLPIELRDAKNDPVYRKELLEKGGKIKVPCLRIESNGKVEWLYESSVINAYLQTRYSS
ncbi:glutaredoxin domain-containing protein [Aliikangiella sp. IMCC44653]